MKFIRYVNDLLLVFILSTPLKRAYFKRIPFDSTCEADTNKRFRMFVDLLLTFAFSASMMVLNVAIFYVLAKEIAFSPSTIDMIRNFVAIEIIM